MNTLDIILSIPLLLGFFNGFRKGLFSQLAGLVALIVIFIFGSLISVHIQNFLVLNDVVAEGWSKTVSYFFTAILVFLVLGIIANILRRIFSTVGLGFLEKLGGGIIGAVKIILLLIIIFYFFEPINKKFEVIPIETLEHSLILNIVEMGSDMVYNLWEINLN